MALPAYLTLQGLIIDRELTEKEWTEVGHTIVRQAEGAAWSLGDWLVVGRKFEKGLGFARAAEVTGYSVSHLRNCWRVAVAYPLDERKKGVPFAIYLESMRESDIHKRKELLDHAIKNNLRVHKFVQYIQQKGTTLRAPGSPKMFYKPVQVKCPECEHVFFAKDHKVGGGHK